MGTAIEYQKLMTEIVYINIPGPAEPTPGMSGGELLHGFLAELYKAPGCRNQKLRQFSLSEMECSLQRIQRIVQYTLEGYW